MEQVDVALVSTKPSRAYLIAGASNAWRFIVPYFARDGRVDRVPAVLQHIDADAGGEVLSGDDHAVRGRDRRL